MENRASQICPLWVIISPWVECTACRAVGVRGVVIPLYRWQWSSAQTSKVVWSLLSRHFMVVSCWLCVLWGGVGCLSVCLRRIICVNSQDRLTMAAALRNSMGAWLFISEDMTLAM